MKHFLILITYKVDLTTIDSLLAEHRKFLQEGYDKIILLMSGPENPRTGGVVVARGKSLEAIKDYFANDPYFINEAASYEFREFNPVKYNSLLTNWILEE